MGEFGKQMISSLSSAASGVAGGFISSAGSKLIDKIFGSDPNQHNLDLMEMQNQFNAREAQKNRDFQLQMYNRTNEYNSPKAQMQRLMEAGLNPDLMYGANGQSFAAQSPSGSQASGSSPVAAVDMQQRAANVALTQAQTRLIEHQADNLDADSSNLNSRTSAQLLYNEYQESIIQGQLQYGDSLVFYTNALRGLTKQQQATEYENMKLLKKEYDNYSVKMENLEANTRNLDTNTYKTEVEAFLATPLAQAQIKRFAAQNAVDYAHAQETLELLLYRKNDMQASMDLKDSQSEYFHWNGKQLQIDYLVSAGKDEESFRYDERQARKNAITVSAYGSTASNFIDSFQDFLYGDYTETTTNNYSGNTHTQRRTHRRSPRIPFRR